MVVRPFKSDTDHGRVPAVHTGPNPGNPRLWVLKLRVPKLRVNTVKDPHTGRCSKIGVTRNQRSHENVLTFTLTTDVVTQLHPNFSITVPECSS